MGLPCLGKGMRKGETLGGCAATPPLLMVGIVIADEICTRSGGVGSKAMPLILGRGSRCLEKEGQGSPSWPLHAIVENSTGEHVTVDGSSDAADDAQSVEGC